MLNGAWSLNINDSEHAFSLWKYSFSWYLPLSIIWTPLSHTALIRGSCPAISVYKRELIQVELNTVPQGNETAKIFFETIICRFCPEAFEDFFLCNKLSSFSKKKVSVCSTYMFPLFLPLKPDVSWTNSELLSNLALKDVKTKKKHFKPHFNFNLNSSLYNDGIKLINNPLHVPVFLDEAIGSFSLIQASSSSTSWRNRFSLSASASLALRARSGACIFFSKM